MAQEKKYILVTGSAGFIGFHLCRRLLKEGYSVIGIDNFNDYYAVELKKARSKELHKYPDFKEERIDIGSLADLEHIFKEYNISHICNLAAQAGVRYSLTHPHIYEQSNLAGFLNILEMTRHFNIPRLVYASSSSVYGGNTKLPFSESDSVDTPISLYAATKKANELMAHCYSHLYGFQSVGLRFFTVYGPWGRPDMAMWLFAEAIKAGKPIKVFNHGDMRRDFTFIDDIINGLCGALFAEGLEKYEIFNLGNHKTENLMDMIGLIENEMGKEAEKEMLPIQPGDVKETYADVEKAHEKLGYSPKTSIEDGIPAFISWFKEYSDLTDFIAENR